MPRIRLTDRFALSEKIVPAKGRAAFFDTEIPGFALRVTAGGARSWSLVYRIGPGRGPKMTMTFGDPTTITVDEARELARKARVQARMSIDPDAQRRKLTEEARKARVARAPLVGLVETYFREAVSPKNRRYETELRALFRRHVDPALGKKPARDIDREDVEKLLKGLIAAETPVAANRVLTALRTMFRWAVANPKKSNLVVDPTVGLEKPTKEVPRDRILSDDELRLVWHASGALSPAYQAFIRILIVTGARRTETALAKWKPRQEGVNLQSCVWTIPAAVAKNGKVHRISLAPLAVEVFEGVPRVERDTTDDTGHYVFSTDEGETRIGEFVRSKKRLDKRIHELLCEQAINTGIRLEDVEAMPHWTLHDLRRTAASGMARLGIAPHIIERALNHSPFDQRGVGRVYITYRYTEEMADAWARWGEHIESIVAGDANLPLNVIRLQSRKVAK